MTCQWFFVYGACYMLVLLGSYTLWFLLWHACGGHWVIAVQVYLGTWWLLWVLWVPFVTCAYDLLVSLYQNCLLDTRICVITIQKWDFRAMIGKKLKMFWHHYHTKQHNAQDFSTNPLKSCLYVNRTKDQHCTSFLIPIANLLSVETIFPYHWWLFCLPTGIYCDCSFPW